MILFKVRTTNFLLDDIDILLSGSYEVDSL